MQCALNSPPGPWHWLWARHSTSPESPQNCRLHRRPCTRVQLAWRLLASPSGAQCEHLRVTAFALSSTDKTLSIRSYTATSPPANPGNSTQHTVHAVCLMHAPHCQALSATPKHTCHHILDTPLQVKPEPSTRAFPPSQPSLQLLTSPTHSSFLIPSLLVPTHHFSRSDRFDQPPWRSVGGATALSPQSLLTLLCVPTARMPRAPPPSLPKHAPSPPRSLNTRHRCSICTSPRPPQACRNRATGTPHLSTRLALRHSPAPGLE